MQNLELAYLAVAYGMTAIMFYTSRGAQHRTVSHVALHHKLNRHVFFWGLLLSGLLFAALMFGWAIPHFALGMAFGFLVAVLVICQIVTGSTPVEGGRVKKAHLVFALALAVCMLLLVASLSLFHTINSTVRWIDGLLALSMALALMHGKHTPKDSYILHEQLFFGLWHSAIFLTVYFG